ncbi:hypothetical protein FKM82_016111 [Ascaphus truei]
MDFSSMSILLLVFLVSCLSMLYMRMCREKASLPPGPLPLPIIGTLWRMDLKNIAISLMELHKKYGDIYTIYQGHQPYVILCGYKAVKETLIDKAEEFSGRGTYPVFYNFTRGDGIAFSDGEKWKELRRFAISALRNFGMGKRSIEERITEEAQYLLHDLRKINGSPVNPIYCMSRTVSNIICSVVFGHRFKYTDEKFQNLVQFIQDNFKIMSTPWGALYNIYPDIMDYIPGPHKDIMKNFKYLADFVRERIEENRETLDHNCPRDYIDCFLIKMEQEKKNLSSFFNDNSLVMSTMILFFGGTETVSTTLRFGFLLIMKYPKVAEKLYKEIDAVIGPHRCPSYEDRTRMPYMQAFILEVLRFTNVIPLALPHKLTKATQIREYKFPKGTVFIPFLTSVHYDEREFKNPEQFDPCNFLDENGQFKKNEALMAFSAAATRHPVMSGGGAGVAILEVAEVA